MTEPVSFKIAKLLKEKGFDIPIQHTIANENYVYDIYTKNFTKNISTNAIANWNDEKYEGILSAPTIAEVVMWLYEKHGIWINPIPRLSSWIFTIQEVRTGNNESLIDIDFYESNTYLKFKGVPTIMNSPTEAYEAAIEYTLNNLI